MLLRGMLRARLESENRHILTLVVVSAVSVGLALNLFLAFASRTSREVLEIAASMEKAGHGDLRQRLEVSGCDELASVRVTLNVLFDSLSATVLTTKLSAASVLSGSQEIASGNLDLSQRTEQQAASLEETAASMEELTANVRHNAESARQAGVLILLCHKLFSSHRTSAAWAYVETGDKPHGELITNGRERIRCVALRAADFPSQCNLREHQASGVLRSFFWR